MTETGKNELIAAPQKLADGGMPFIDAVKQSGFSGCPAKGSQPIPNEPVQVYEDSPFWNEVRHMTAPEDRIAQMAREAGFPAMAVDNLSEADRARLTAFARLVAEDCAGVVDDATNEAMEAWCLGMDAYHAAEAATKAIRARYSKEG